MEVRKIIKTEAKKCLGGNFMSAVIVVLIAGAISFIMSLASNLIIEYLVYIKRGTTSTQVVLDYISGLISFEEYNMYNLARTKLGWVNAVCSIVGLLAGIFTIAKTGFFLKITGNENKKATIKDFFKEGRFLESLGFHVIKTLKIFLWTLLLIIPGIVKMFSYSMAEYIKYNNPKKSTVDCLHESARIMNGYKGSLFILILSFIGWFILGGIITGFVGYIPGVAGTVISSIVNFVIMGILSAYVVTCVTVFYRELTSPYLNEKYGTRISRTENNYYASNKEEAKNVENEPFAQTDAEEHGSAALEKNEKTDDKIKDAATDETLGNIQSGNDTEINGKSE